jgi:hypothetical protein
VLQVQTEDFETLLLDRGSNRARPSLLMCCCTTDYSGRGARIRQLMIQGACSDEGVNASRVHMADYITRLTRAKFKLLMVGNGHACFRDTEQLVAGAVLALSGYLSGGPTLWGPSAPALHVPVQVTHTRAQTTTYENIKALTAALLDTEYRSSRRRGPSLTLTRPFWPY